MQTCPALSGYPADPQLAITHLRVRTLRDIEMAEHGLELSHRGLPSAPCAHTLSLLGVASHPHVPSGLATGMRVAPPGSAHTQQWLSHGSAPVAWSAVDRATTGGLDAPAGSPLRPCGHMPRPAGTASQEGGGHVRPPAVLGR